VLTVGGLEISLDGEVFVDAEAEPDVGGFEKKFEAAKQLLARMKEKTKPSRTDTEQCLRTCSEHVSKGARYACDVICKERVRRPRGTLGFTCNPLFCACRGDADCNDLFTTGLCGPRDICIDDVCYCVRE
jgi:hypothetical protein